MARIVYATLVLALAGLAFVGGLATGYTAGYPQGRMDCEQNVVQERQQVKSLLENKDQLDAYYRAKGWTLPRE